MLNLIQNPTDTGNIIYEIFSCLGYVWPTTSQPSQLSSYLGEEAVLASRQGLERFQSSSSEVTWHLRAVRFAGDISH